MAGFWQRWLGRRRGESLGTLRRRYQRFQHLIDGNNRVLDLIADAEEKLGGDHLFDRHYLEWLSDELPLAVSGVVYDLNAMTDNRYGDLIEAFERICQKVHGALSPTAALESDLTLSFDSVDRDYADLVGDKVACLAELRRLGLSVPDGFVAPAAACRRQFMAAGIDRLLAEHVADFQAPASKALDAVAARLQEAVRRTPLDATVARALRNELRTPERTRWRYAVRSSALGEGGEHSFAGLHTTLLNVPPADVANAYREVLASVFSPVALRYRVERGLPVADAVMAVAFLAMIPARASGVIHTVTPATPQLDVMAVSAAWGLGPTVVQGSGPVDSFELSRDPTPRVLTRRIADKTSALRPRADAGTDAIPVPADDRQAACVSDAELARLGQIALRIEHHAGQHQEIEWAVTPDGELVFLQTRALRVAPRRIPAPAELARLLADRTALIRGKGVIACGGVGAGPVWVAHGVEGTESFPTGAVLIAQAPLPQYSSLLARASAVITSVGSSTGHLATVAREYRVPMIVDVSEATALLQPGMEVTVDAEENVIYAGVVHELLRHHLSRPRADVDFEEFRTLRRLVRRIAPLWLTDPDAENFRARSCTTCHDVVRFAHEVAVRELVNMPDLAAQDRRRFVRRLRLPIPLDLDVLDLGGGIAAGAEGSVVDPASIESAPLLALLTHLTASWRTDPVRMDVGSFLSSATQGAALAVPQTGRMRPNLAVISKDYTNLHLHLGYHYNMVDCRLTEVDDANYVYFRFHGGVTEITRRSRRARTIAAILEAHGFAVETKGDMVIGRLRGIPAPALRERLEMVGKLIGYTRQLDVLMRHEGTVEEFARDFCEREAPTGNGNTRAEGLSAAGASRPG
jgi:pyruvate, water dikinase